jgi:hypothetical protein
VFFASHSFLLGRFRCDRIKQMVNRGGQFFIQIG